MKTQVNIAKIKEAIKIISEFNKLRLRDIEFVENGIIIEVPDKILKEWSYTGLNNKDFIDCDCYLEKDSFFDKYVSEEGYSFKPNID